MLENADYLTIKRYALDNGLTRQQVINATHIQLKALVGHSISAGFIRKVKRLLISEFDDKRRDARMESVKLKVKTYMDANFPSWESERGKTVGNDDKNYPFIKIWFRGKPPGDDVNI